MVCLGIVTFRRLAVGPVSEYSSKVIVPCSSNVATLHDPAFAYGGSGSPQYIIASDLPLQGSNRALTTEMAKAVAFILGQQGWKAGKFSVGFQSCDDSTVAAGGYDTAKCTANASAYAGNTENPVFTFRLGQIGLASTGIYSLDRSIFRFVAPGATDRKLVRIGGAVTLNRHGAASGAS